MKIGVGKDIRLIGSEASKWKERKGHLLTSEMITGVFGKNIQLSKQLKHSQVLLQLSHFFIGRLHSFSMQFLYDTP